jgi:hypothetical protein
VDEPHYDLGVLLGMKGELDEAIACYRQTIALDPKHAMAHNNLGKAISGGPIVPRRLCRKSRPPRETFGRLVLTTGDSSVVP